MPGDERGSDPNSQIHVGNLTASYLPADIFARYNRLAGNQVIMVSGSDAHGTPVTVRPDAEGVTPLEVYQKYHAGFLELFQKLGLNYDLFTSTHTENHFKLSQAIFLASGQYNFLYTERQNQWYSQSQGRYLPDRYVEGTCYICGYQNARGDQCDQCGNLLDGTQLIEPRSKIDGALPSCARRSTFFWTWASFSRRSWISCASERAIGVPTCCGNHWAKSWPMSCTAERSPATSIGASPSPSPAGRASGCTSGSRRSSAICLPPSNGRRSIATPTPGTIGGTTLTPGRTTSSVKIISPSMPSSGPGSSSAPENGLVSCLKARMAAS